MSDLLLLTNALRALSFKNRAWIEASSTMDCGTSVNWLVLISRVFNLFKDLISFGSVLIALCVKLRFVNVPNLPISAGIFVSLKRKGEILSKFTFVIRYSLVVREIESLNFRQGSDLDGKFGDLIGRQIELGQRSEFIQA